MNDYNHYNEPSLMVANYSDRRITKVTVVIWVLLLVFSHITTSGYDFAYNITKSR